MSLGKIEISPSGRAACRFCNVRIEKGSPRVVKQVIIKPWAPRVSKHYFHLHCAIKELENVLDEWRLTLSSM